MNKPTITIGIAAYNEGRTIYKLLMSCMQQDFPDMNLIAIIVVTDGCTDKTVAEVKRTQIPNLKHIDLPERMGKGNALDIICQIAESDILILLDGDVAIKDKYFSQKLIAPIIRCKADITGAKVVHERPRTLFTRILAASNRWKDDLYGIWNQGNNVYTCHGRALALHKGLYKKLKYAQIIADDAYAFLYAVTHEHTYTYVPEALIYYNLPATFADHLKQSKRFQHAIKQLYNQFQGKDIVQYFSIPKSLILKTGLTHLIKNPIDFTLYVIILIYAKLTSIGTHDTLAIWDVATSSKK